MQHGSWVRLTAAIGVAPFPGAGASLGLDWLGGSPRAIFFKVSGGLNCLGGGGVCEMKAIHGVKKMVNYYPLIAHSAQRMKF